MRSNVVYEFRCAQSSATASYVGSTKRHFQNRVAEHGGRSIRTGKSVSSPKMSSIRDHSNHCSCNIDFDSFAILGTTKDELELRILESLYISTREPNLNDRQSAFPLYIV